MTSDDGPKEKHIRRAVCRETWGSKEAMMEANDGGRTLEDHGEVLRALELGNVMDRKLTLGLKGVKAEMRHARRLG